MDTLRFRARISGRVQRVFFRISTRNEAKRLGLAGFVRNESDGSVTLEVEGKREAVERLLSFVAHGPPLARVDEVRKEGIPVTGEKTFLIIRSVRL